MTIRSSYSYLTININEFSLNKSISNIILTYVLSDNEIILNKNINLLNLLFGELDDSQVDSQLVKQVINESIELRCCKHWNLLITISNNQLMNYLTINLIVNVNITNQSYQLIDPLTNELIGYIVLSINYYPNHQSFYQLTLDSLIDKSYYLPKLLLNELIELINSESNILYKDELMKCSEFILSFSELSDDNDITSLERYINFASNNRINTLTNKIDRYNWNSTIYVYKTIAITKVIVNDINRLLPMSPILTIELLEKQLFIYLTVLSTNNLTIESNDQLNSNEDISLTMKQSILFSVLVSLWIIQQSFLANQLVDQLDSQVDNELVNQFDDSLDSCNVDSKLVDLINNHISYKEYSQLFNIFIRYDSLLDGNISNVDLYYILQEMGEEYTNREVDIITNLIDKNHINCIDFNDFINWWIRSDIH